ncbi:MAG: glycosyltransferase [Planctomycetes bacterium]|nr:glycosyltransferase [Planctomycetota bacterium]
MKILLVAHGYPPHSLAGVEVYTRWFARTLAARHEVRVFSTFTPPEGEDLSLVDELLDGIPVTFLVNRFADYDPIREVRHDAIADRFAVHLERVRPDLVHFQHLIKLSATLLDVCRARGIPTVLTLHDYWFLCPVITLLRRDLELCPAPGDLAWCTRCEVATAYLNREEAGTYYIAGMLEPMAKPGQWAALRGIYADRFDPVFAPEDATAPAVATLRIGLVRRFLRDRLDLAGAVASPSRFLEDLLESHGLAPGRIRHLPNGIETAGLRDADAAPPPPPLRVLYLGTINKHKGVHVLVEALNRLVDRPVEADIHGVGPDVRYEAWVRGLVRNARVRFGGRYDRADLPALLASHHVVVMPSLWYENYPIVIREAFAAGVPVIAPRLGAMPEAIRDGVDGLLYGAGDAGALAAALARLADEPELLGRLSRGIGPVLGMDEHVAAYEALYAEAAAAARRGEPTAGGRRAPRILLAGPSSSGAGFARVLGDLLVAGTRPPRPEVTHVGPRGDLAPALEAFTARLGLAHAVRSSAEPAAAQAAVAAGQVDCAVLLPGVEESVAALLRAAGIPILDPDVPLHHLEHLV